ncbi:sigma-54 interaction domain-containing protein [Geosporobacter ferrireducens]|uniref:Sigma-54-dependent Fis family transcriptional regulator n=1 Tax=Geosporobacter ferrireducens TaxID=1424294 RepID=A0A1D8GPE6_9FIRM|nr:sigma 54-interacting transcriptional regulator [Geosporobacter ferrireducens]AOT72836.1 sigma-54-dependent Fis family transcriptional regulator [Geosporobacter ferrireducens]MTI55235.1 PAS domain S-box protein [Geosporobacter ferrireducens]
MKPYFYEILEIVLQSIDEGVHVIDNEGRTIIYNKAMAELEGMNPEDVLDKPLLDLFPSLDWNNSTLLKVLSTEKSLIDHPQTYLNNKHKEITTISTTVPVYFDKEKVGALEIAKNITKIKALSDQIMTLQLQLAKPQNRVAAKEKKFTFDSIIGKDEGFLKAIEFAKKAAFSSSSVLIYGETGTGKELVAQSIHYAGMRKNKAFVAQNCAALPEALLEGILFGTVKGGFTGAVDRPGLFEQANGGTIFLDELNSMGLLLQSKLLRVLQEGYVRRIGGIKDIPIDVRIIASTNEEPYEAVEKGILRKDLFYRINVIPINLPPLRERKDDIEVLMNGFIEKINHKMNKKIIGAEEKVLKAFKSYRWPGNVRELENTIEAAMNIIENETILKMEHFPPQISAKLFAPIPTRKLTFRKNLTDTLLEIESDLIIKALRESDDNISKAAEQLGIKRQTLQHKMKKYNIARI